MNGFRVAVPTNADLTEEQFLDMVPHIQKMLDHELEKAIEQHGLEGVEEVKGQGLNDFIRPYDQYGFYTEPVYKGAESEDLMYVVCYRSYKYATRALQEAHNATER